MQIVIDIPEEQYDRIIDHTEGVYDTMSLLTIVENGKLLKDSTQWKQLKETIVEIRDNNVYEGNGATELCKFLMNYMEVLEDDRG